MSVRARQLLLARFLDDPAFEAELRRHPGSFAAAHGCDPAFVQWLAALASHRVEGFRRSRVVKARRRGHPHDSDERP